MVTTAVVIPVRVPQVAGNVVVVLAVVDGLLPVKTLYVLALSPVFAI